MIFVVLTFYGSIIGVFKDRLEAESNLKQYLIDLIKEDERMYEDILDHSFGSNKIILDEERKDLLKVHDYLKGHINISDLSFEEIKTYMFVYCDYLSEAGIGDFPLDLEYLFNEVELT